MEKYSKRIIIIHWLTLALLALAWFMGHNVEAERHEGTVTVVCYLAHSLVGATILLLTLARLAFRKMDGVPPALGDSPADKVAKGIQYLLYALLILLPVSGMMVVVTSDVSKALLAWDSVLLPAKFTGVPAHEVHEVLVNVLIVLVVVHVLGALKHQFVLKDNIMDRMLLRKNK